MLLRSSRCVKNAACAGNFLADIPQRFLSEVHACTLLHHRNIDVVRLVGVYSTETHPFGIIYEHMDGLDLKQYLRNEPNAGRLKLVLIPLHTLSLQGTHPLMLLDDSLRA